jgi:hypothetical protein
MANTRWRLPLSWPGNFQVISRNERLIKSHPSFWFAKRHNAKRHLSATIKNLHEHYTRVN